MFYRHVPAFLALLLIAGCASPAKLTLKSEEKLARGDRWHAWELATRALDKEPGNPKSIAAATAAGVSIAQDWERRILALADVDSMQAAEQVLEFAAFRSSAARYLTIPVSLSWPATEMRIRHTAARRNYVEGKRALEARRPKKAHRAMLEAERHVAGYRDAAKIADRALEKAIDQVAIVPFRAPRTNGALGIEVAERWRDEMSRELAPPVAPYTRVLGATPIEKSMTLAQLADLSRQQAVRVAKKAGADRVVWGTIGDVQSSTRLEVFKDVVARRVVEKDEKGKRTTRWVEVPIEVVARVRDVAVEVEYEVTAVQDGAALAHQKLERAMSARVVWTSHDPVGETSSYALVSEHLRTTNPSRARELEARWKEVCGESTRLSEVLDARRAARGAARYSRESLPRFIAGAAFVFLEDLPPAEDLALAALARSSGALRDDLVRLDPIDDVDLGVTVSETSGR